MSERISLCGRRYRSRGAPGGFVAPFTGAVVGLVLIAVGACDTLYLPKSVQSTPSPSVETAAAPAPETPAPAAPPEPRVAVEPPPPQLAPPVIDNPALATLGAEGLPGPDRLIGMDEEEVTAILGPPAFARRDAPARMWQYGNRACLLDVFLYRKKDAFRVAHVEVRSRSVVAVSAKDCFLDLLARHHSPKKG